jgi:hypothetical protein
MEMSAQPNPDSRIRFLQAATGRRPVPDSVRAITDSSYQIEVSYHQFLLVPFDGSPVLDPTTVGPVLALDPQVPSAVIVRTGVTSDPAAEQPATTASSEPDALIDRRRSAAVAASGD